MGKQWKQWQTLFSWAPKSPWMVTAAMKLWRHLLIGRKIMTNLVQFSSVAQSGPTLCDPMNCSMPGLPVHHQLPEFTQTHVHWVNDDNQPSHPLSSPSPPAPNPSQHQSLFQWVNSLHEVAKVLGVTALESFLPKKSQGWSPSERTGWIFLQSKGSYAYNITIFYRLTLFLFFLLFPLPPPL